LLNDALRFAISMSLKLRNELETSSSFDYLMEEDANVAFELASNLKMKFVGFWIFFPF